MAGRVPQPRQVPGNFGWPLVGCFTKGTVKIGHQQQQLESMFGQKKKKKKKGLHKEDAPAKMIQARGGEGTAFHPHSKNPTACRRKNFSFLFIKIKPAKSFPCLMSSCIES